MALSYFQKGRRTLPCPAAKNAPPYPGAAKRAARLKGRRLTSKSGSHTTSRTTVVNRRSMSWADARKVEVEEEGQERWSWVHARKEEVEEEER